MMMGILTGVLLVMFLGIVGWAWDARRRDDFNDAAALPLREDVHARETQP